MSSKLYNPSEFVHDPDEKMLFLQQVELKESSAQIGDNILTPFADRIVVEEDKFRSGYECLNCDGEGTVDCKRCAGTGTIAGSRCVFCTNGQTVCPTCQGKGATVVIPETAKRRVTTGIVRAIGPKIQNRSLVGQRILYSNFAGNHMELIAENNKKILICILNESEMILRLDKTLKATDSTADFTTGQ
jgi:co-chaperonin GroES (HSP10)